jgi:hypothetical protein
VQILFVALQIDDWITDKLTRPVVRDVAAAFDFEQLDTVLGKKFGRCDEVFFFR